jgi:hypothetical protein
MQQRLLLLRILSFSSLIVESFLVKHKRKTPVSANFMQSSGERLHSGRASR